MNSKTSSTLTDLFHTTSNVVDFLDNSSDSFLFINEEGRILHANKQIEKIFGFSQKQILRKHIKYLFPAEYLSEQTEVFTELLNKKIIRPVKTNMIFRTNKRNEIKHVNVSIDPVKTNNGKMICCSIRDITKDVEYVEKLKSDKEEAEEMALIKTSFLSQLSHEIRSPLNIMINFTQLVREVLNTETQETLKEEFAIINNAGSRIIRTVDLVLSMSEIQSGELELHNTHFDLMKEIVARVYRDFRYLASQRKIKLSFHCTLDEAMIYSDEYTVYQSLMNIVDNAFKYTETGKIDIKMDQQKNGQYFVVVSDTGIGMSEEYQKDLFKPFHQEDTGFTGKFKGNGLGLSLVKKYCEMNNIKISIKSKKGVGTKVKLLFPPQNFKTKG